MSKIIAETFKKNGFIVINNFFSELEAKNIVNCANRFYNLPEVKNSYMKYYENTSNDRILSRMEYFYNYDNFIKSLIDTKITPTLTTIVGEDMSLFKDKLNWKLPGGGAFKPHQDFEAWSDFPPQYYATCAMFADSCTEENGCLEMVEDADKSGILKNENGCIDKELVDSFNWKKVLVSPTDLVIFNALVPHKSEPNKSNSTRRVFYFTYNKLSEGSYYEDYFSCKRIILPDHKYKETLTINQLNLAINTLSEIIESRQHATRWILVE